MSGVIDKIEKAQLRRLPEFDSGDRVRVHFQVIEGTRRRTQVFEGVVIKRQGSGLRETFTVRKQSFGVGVERTFPLHTPKIEKIEVAARGEVRRAKLYYLRDRVGKRARVRERAWSGPEADIDRELLLQEAPEADAPETVEESAAGETGEVAVENDVTEAASPEGESVADAAKEDDASAEDAVSEEVKDAPAAEEAAPEADSDEPAAEEAAPEADKDAPAAEDAAAAAGEGSPAAEDDASEATAEAKSDD